MLLSLGQDGVVDNGAPNVFGTDHYELDNALSHTLRCVPQPSTGKWKWHIWDQTHMGLDWHEEAA